MPAVNGVGLLSPAFGAGVTEVHKAVLAVSAAAPAFWLDTLLSTLSPGDRSLNEAEQSCTDYPYPGRNLLTAPAHDSIQVNVSQRPTYTFLPNGAGSLTFDGTKCLALATAFGASTSHSFGFVYNPTDAASLAVETLFSTFDGAANQLKLFTKLQAPGIAGNGLAIYTSAFAFLSALQAGVHSYVLVLDAGSTTVSLYLDSNPVAVSTAVYAPLAMQNPNVFWGATVSSDNGIIGKSPNMIYFPRAITAPEIAAVAKYNKLQYGSL